MSQPPVQQIPEDLFTYLGVRHERASYAARLLDVVAPVYVLNPLGSQSAQEFAMTGWVDRGPDVGLQSAMQLRNPTGSRRLLLLDQIIIHTQSVGPVAIAIGFDTLNQELTTLAPSWSKHVQGGPSGATTGGPAPVGQLRHDAGPFTINQTLIGDWNLVQNVKETFTFDPPLKITENRSLIFMTIAVNLHIHWFLQWREQIPATAQPL